MEQELVELFDAAKKAADSAAIDGVSSSGPEVSRCVDALKRLKSFPVTYDVLVSTQVGKRLRPLTKHPREKIQIVASNLLDIWKKIVIEETTRNKKNGSTGDKSSVTTGVVKPDSGKIDKVQKTSAVKVEKVSTAETVKVEKTGSVSRSETVQVEKKETNGDSVMDRGEAVKVEKIIEEEKQAPSVRKPSQGTIATPKLTQLIKCNDSSRDKIRELLANALSKVTSEADEEIIDEVNACDPIRVAVSVESVMFEKLFRVVYVSPSSAQGNLEDEGLVSATRSPDANSALQRLKDERDAAVRQTQLLQQDLDMLKRRGQRKGVRGFSLMFAAFVGLIGIMVGLILNLLLSSPPPTVPQND